MGIKTASAKRYVKAMQALFEEIQHIENVGQETSTAHRHQHADTVVNYLSLGLEEAVEKLREGIRKKRMYFECLKP